MVNPQTPVIITAIADSDFESFVAGNLHSQGWDVVARSVDITSLNIFIDQNQQLAKNVVLIYTPDLPGLNDSHLTTIRSQVRQLIGFATESERLSGVLLAIRPSDPAELITEVRGLIRREFREPLISVLKSSPLGGAKIISIGSAGTATGATTLAINLAMESSLLEKRTLLIDANTLEPAIAITLELRNLKNDQSPRLISPLLWSYELTENKILHFNEFIKGIMTNFDLIVIDLGSVSNLPDKLTDRRWGSGALIWCCDNSDELWLSSRPDEIGQYRLSKLITDFTKTKIKANLQLIANLESPKRRGDTAALELTAQIDQLNSSGQIVLPRDSRAVAAALAARCSLSEASPKSSLRKAISKLASDL
jgi:Mrp family chromosome partitioning ATPase